MIGLGDAKTRVERHGRERARPLDQAGEREKAARTKQWMTRREKARDRAALDELGRAARAGQNVMPALIEASAARATVGEMMTTLKKVYGVYVGAPEW